MTEIIIQKSFLVKGSDLKRALAEERAFKADRLGHNGRHDARPSRITYMAHAKGYVMARHPGCIPFAISEKEWLAFPLWERAADIKAE